MLNRTLKRSGKSNVAHYISIHDQSSRNEIVHELGLSPPTVSLYVSELLGIGLLCENGKNNSTGGRRANNLSINKDYMYVIGVEISKNYIHLVLVNTVAEILYESSVRLSFENSLDYSYAIGKHIMDFAQQEMGLKDKIHGVALAIPGILDNKHNILRRSHTLQVENVSIQQLTQFVDFEKCYAENDANCAAFAEIGDTDNNAVYLSLNNTFGGSIFINGELYGGDNYKSSEFGHVILHPGGYECYCGKKGCADAYCSVKALLDNRFESLDDFFTQLERGNPECIQMWDTYLDNLAILVVNLRMAFDCDIVIGGNIGGYFDKYRVTFIKKTLAYNNFDNSNSYIRIGGYKKHASSVGAAKHMIDQYIQLL